MIQLNLTKEKALYLLKSEGRDQGLRTLRHKHSNYDLLVKGASKSEYIEIRRNLIKAIASLLTK